MSGSARGWLERSGYGPGLNQALEVLNLQGILNVFGCVADSPGHIIVMMMNHPEHMDPALIQSIWVNEKLFLGHTLLEDIILVLEHDCQTGLGMEECK